MTFLIIKVLTPELESKAVRIDLKPTQTTIDVKSILKANNISFNKIQNWKQYKVDFYI